MIRSYGSRAAEDMWQGQRGARQGTCGLRLPVQMCMLPLGIFKGLQIRKDEELCIS